MPLVTIREQSRENKKWQPKNHRKFFNKSNYMLCSLCILPSFFRCIPYHHTFSSEDLARTSCRTKQSRVVFSFLLVFLGDKIFLIYEKNSVYFLQQSCPLFVAFASRPGHRQKSVNIVLCYCAVLIILPMGLGLLLNWIGCSASTVIMLVTQQYIKIGDLLDKPWSTINFNISLKVFLL